MTNQKSKISQEIKAILHDVILSVGDITDVGVYDVHHQLRISVEYTNGFDFWDDDAFDKLDQIIINSPKTPTDFIYFKLGNFYCVVRPIRQGTYWIFVYRINQRLDGLIPPYSQWQQKILHLIEQMDSTNI